MQTLVSLTETSNRVLKKLTSQTVQGDSAAGSPRTAPRAADQVRALRGAAQIDRPRARLARGARRRNGDNRADCRSPEMQRSPHQHDNLDGIYRAGSGQGRHRRQAAPWHRRCGLARRAGRMVAPVRAARSGTGSILIPRRTAYTRPIQSASTIKLTIAGTAWKAHCLLECLDNYV
jgi:hypothetical protein